jgi:hypothetical protein
MPNNRNSICGLAEDINKSPHYIRENESCGADHTEYGFFEPPGKIKESIDQKEPKWFEQ